jgi:hypothetical protein
LPIVPEQDYSGLIGSAVGRSLLRLEDEDCRRALGGEAAVAKLTEMWEGGRIRTPRNRQEWLAVQGAVAVYTNGKILINRDGGFESGRHYLDGPGGKDLVRDTAQSLEVNVGVRAGELDLWALQELIILHELGHATGCLIKDAGDPAESHRNNIRVWEACFK